jgi:putative tryptophan/tyrosine transport system substrate-binding protein
VKRRQFIALLGGAAAIWPLAARAQQPAMPVIGWLYGVSAAGWTDRADGFRRGLGEAGFVDGRNVTIEYRWAEDQYGRLPAMAADLVGRKVALIVAGGQAVQAAMAATRSIPIVFTTGVDPVAAGSVASLSRPGGNATGFTTFGRELASKLLELLRELLPTARRIALLVNPNDPADMQTDTEQAEAAARRLGLEIVVVGAGSEKEVESALAAAAQQGAAAIFVGNDAFLVSRGERIAALALRHVLPTSLPTRPAGATAALMSYGPNVPDMYRQAGVYVGRILKGEKPGDLPVLQPTKFELIINLKTAKALDLTIPESFLLRADEVIE